MGSLPTQARQHYVIKFVSDLRQVYRFLLVLRFLPPIKLIAMVKLKYKCIVESGVKHHKQPMLKLNR